MALGFKLQLIMIFVNQGSNTGRERRDSRQVQSQNQCRGGGEENRSEEPVLYCPTEERGSTHTHTHTLQRPRLPGPLVGGGTHRRTNSKNIVNIMYIRSIKIRKTYS